MRLASFSALEREKAMAAVRAFSSDVRQRSEFNGAGRAEATEVMLATAPTNTPISMVRPPEDIATTQKPTSVESKLANRETMSALDRLGTAHQWRISASVRTMATRLRPVVKRAVVNENAPNKATENKGTSASARDGKTNVAKKLRRIPCNAFLLIQASRFIALGHCTTVTMYFG